MSIQKQITLRYHAPGHARFSIPGVLCRPETADRLVAGLKRMEGIFRVDLYLRQGKLSIRYHEAICDFSHVAAALHDLTALIESTPFEPAHSAPNPPAISKRSGAAAWMGTLQQKVRESLAGTRVVHSQEREKFALEFLTDVLVLYLVRIHWHLITQHWLKRPWQFRYEWMAALYLIFLLVRSKRPQS